MLNLKKILFFSFFLIFAINNIMAMDLYEEEQKSSILRNRFDNFREKIKEEYSYEDMIISDLGEAGNLFKQKNYEESFFLIYKLSGENVPQADYLLAQFYEDGLGKIFKSLKDACRLYTKAILDSGDKEVYYVEKKAEERLTYLISYGK